jgi:type II secretory pathway component PulK
MRMRPAARPGVALMLVLGIIVILGTIASAIALATRSTTTIAANYRARVVARYAAESGVTIATAELEQNLAALADTAPRRLYLNHLDMALGNSNKIALGDARIAVGLVDVSSRLDVNNADVSSLRRLFSFFTDAPEAAHAASAIRAYIGGGLNPIAAEEPAPLGLSATTGLQAARPLRSLDELSEISGVPSRLAEKAAEYLTVDGDGTINRATASAPVLAAAGGELRDEPSRILVVSRGWQEGHPLTHEIQALYAISGNKLNLVRWRERDL